MVRSRFTILAMTATLMAGVFLAPKTAVAQESQDYYTYVSEWAVPRAQWAAFDKQQESDNSTLNKLVADGTLVDWGDLDTRVHQLDGYTHANWMTATSRENLLKALEQQWSTATNSSYVASTKHQDLFLHTIAHGGKTASASAGYLRVAFYQARPGDEGDFQELLMKKIKPMLDSSIADGTLTMYNIDVEDIHTGPPGTFNLAMLFPDGAAMDKFYTALGESMKSDPSMGRLVTSLTIPEAHRDDLARLTSYQHK